MVSVPSPAGLPAHYALTRSQFLFSSVSIAAAFLLLGAFGIHVATELDLWHWWVPLVFVGGMAAADFGSGLVHWGADTWARRRGSAQAPLALAAIAFFLIEFLAGWWAPIRPLARVSPFHYFSGAAILGGGADTLFNVSILGMATIAASAVAYWQFERRDL